jgi:hypothetical protein
VKNLIILYRISLKRYAREKERERERECVIWIKFELNELHISRGIAFFFLKFIKNKLRISFNKLRRCQERERDI